MALLARATVALALSVSACALGGGSGSGDDALPVAGTGPFAKLADPTGTTPLPEPFVLVDPLSDISDPAPLVLPGGGLRVFFGRGAGEIRRADLPVSLAEAAADPVSVLAATPDEGRAVAPSVVRRGDAVLLYYETQDGVARATSTDGGATFERDGIVLAGAAGPGAVVVDDRVFLYFTRPGEATIEVATATDGVHFTVAPDPVLSPSGGSWDATGLGDPAALGGRTATGDVHVGLYYTGTGMDGVAAIGYAGSRDGFGFEALAAPVLDAAAPSERGPAALVHPDQVILLFTQNRSGKLAIAAATDP